MNQSFFKKGFTLIEILVVMSIISVLAVTLYINFNQAQQGANDEIRKNGLKELQLALKLYKAQYGKYPDQGCGTPGVKWAGPGPMTASWGDSCDEYILGLVPEFIPALPTDPTREDEDNLGYIYLVASVDSPNDSYKVLVHMSVESKFVTSYDDEFARCPSENTNPSCGITPQKNTYGIYSAGVAEKW